MKILVVDDDKGFLAVLTKILSSKGYVVSSAEEGKQARELLDVEQFDLIISDVFMPTLDGTRFHSYVMEFTDFGNIPFIFISGFDDEHTRKVVVDSKIDFFVSKTAPVETIVKLIEQIKARIQMKTA